MAGILLIGRVCALLSMWAGVAMAIVSALLLLCVVGARVCSGAVSAVLFCWQQWPGWSCSRC
ncbi:hypothetical protein [Mycobacterium leprae]|uniref:hypothetical protein n=1 Tax=Mycobacterium leprae TaxID=1769 RepID=UPI000AD809B7|nr:hypothetical protein [Mycobacterium leprae]